MNEPSIETIFVTEDEAGNRIDKLLAERFPHQSRTYFQYLLDKELVLVNGKRVKKRELVKLGDEIEVEFALTPELNLQPELIPLDILFEDEHLIVVNKPAGLVVHPAPGNWSGTFVNALLYHCRHLSTGSDPARPGIVHRLDKDTSGLLVAAKTEIAHRKLVYAFAERSIHKEYLAICCGHLSPQTIELPIGRHPVHRQQMTVVNTGGKLSKTHIYPIADLGQFSLVQCVIETGRTHQIRVHLKHCGAPVLGDALYGNLTLNKKIGAPRQFLHAYRLSFSHPITEEWMMLEAPLPSDMIDFIHKFSQTLPTIPTRLKL